MIVRSAKLALRVMFNMLFHKPGQLCHHHTGGLVPWNTLLLQYTISATLYVH
jgi:hypothetical protein